MSDGRSSEDGSQEEMISARFANMILEQSNMALMFLGRIPHPETGETILDVETARHFIDQLEMLEVKTKGNLDKRESALLQQSLTAVRLAFVEAVDKGRQAGARKTEPTPSSPTAAAAAPDAAVPAQASDHGSSHESESRKKFSKKY